MGMAGISLAMISGAHMPQNRNVIYLIVAVLAVTTAVLGYQLYQERKEPKGIQMNVGPGGISIEKK